jgi:hypothetical protein
VSRGRCRGLYGRLYGGAWQVALDLVKRLVKRRQKAYGPGSSVSVGMMRQNCMIVVARHKPF